MAAKWAETVIPHRVNGVDVLEIWSIFFVARSESPGRAALVRPLKKKPTRGPSVRTVTLIPVLQRRFLGVDKRKGRAQARPCRTSTA